MAGRVTGCGDNMELQLLPIILSNVASLFINRSVHTLYHCVGHLIKLGLWFVGLTY